MKPRGLRNHNPLNIKIGNDWRGEVELNTDGVFEQFTADYWGYRAAFVILRKYIRKYGRNTIRKIIHSWSPDGTEKEYSYMSKVSEWSGIGLDELLYYEDRDRLCRVVQAMARFENGVEVDMTPIRVGYDAA